jgi:hypothetical protein
VGVWVAAQGCGWRTDERIKSNSRLKLGIGLYFFLSTKRVQVVALDDRLIHSHFRCLPCRKFTL